MDNYSDYDYNHDYTIMSVLSISVSIYTQSILYIVYYTIYNQRLYSIIS